jgi:putative transcriptional regulator
LTKAERNDLADLVDVLVNGYGKDKHDHDRSIREHQTGLAEAITHAKGDERGVRLHRPREIDVKAVHAKVSMTQNQFATRFGFSAATLRHWERSDSLSRDPALALLNVIERNPQAVIKALV